MKVESLTWLQTTSLLKYYSYHICCPNLACLNSLENQLHGASTYQIAGSTPKLVRNYATKPKGVYDFFSKISNSKHYPYLLPFFQKYYKHPIYFPSFHQLLRPIILLLPKKVGGTCIFNIQIKNYVQERETTNDPNSPF